MLRRRIRSRRRAPIACSIWVDEDALAHLHSEVFGKRILITNRHEWSTEEILTGVPRPEPREAVFRQLKDDEHLAVRPQYHWTDQKIHVHAFICLLALLLARSVERNAGEAHRRGRCPALLELLATIRLTMMLRPSGEKGGRPRTEWQLEDADDDAAPLFRAVVPNRAAVCVYGRSRLIWLQIKSLTPHHARPLTKLSLAGSLSAPRPRRPDLSLSLTSAFRLACSSLFPTAQEPEPAAEPRPGTRPCRCRSPG